MLERNRASLQRQSDSDWAQTLLVDPVGMGIAASYRRMAHYTPVGGWVWILDDDDECIYDDLVADVRRIATQQPETQVIMVKMDHGPALGVLPDDAVWKKAPVHGHLGVSSFIVRRDVWQRHAKDFGARYAGDYDFITSVWQERPVVVWHDVIASRVQRISYGVSEREYAVAPPEEWR